MKHLGDITLIHGNEIEPVDCIIGGSPCQDLSVAGKRAGLSGERSGLFMEQIRIVKEMRKRYGKPRYMVWENVPGAFSSNNGEDFRAVLEEVTRIADETAVIPRPPKGKWSCAGCVMGDGWSVAWRTHDAQFWGVPQRRRRIALVADYGGESALEILFERESVSGDSAESGETREGTAGEIEDRVAYAVRIRGRCDGSGKGALIQTEKSGTSNDQMVCYGFGANAGATAQGIAYAEEQAPTLSASRHDATVFCLQGNGIDRADTAGCNGKGWTENVSYTLNTIDRPAAAFAMQGFGDYKKSDQASGLKARDYKDATDLVCQTTGVNCRNLTEPPELYPTLQAKPNGGQSLNYSGAVRTRCIVRRHTPLECERLQGYPDEWTDIGDWTDSKGKLHKAADAPRYKALGNSIALPFWGWMLRRMSEYLPTGATMGSLFDGIGGFPLLWERIHGAGTARWASEIEEFAIAVTKIRFPEGMK